MNILQSKSNRPSSILKSLVKSAMLVPALLALGLLAGTAQAGTVYWDGGSTNIAGNGNGASGGGNGTWDTTIANWDQGSNQAYAAWNNANNDTAVLGGTAGTVTLAAPITVGGLVIMAADTITSNTLTFGTAGTISNTASAVIASMIAGSVAITKSGSGALTLSSTNIYSGGTVINAGSVLNVQSASFGTGAITIGGTSSLTPAYGVYPVLANSLAVNSGVTLTISEGSQYFGIQFNGAVSGSGTIMFGGNNNAQSGPSLGLLNANNTFTGAVTWQPYAGGGPTPILIVNSLADSTNRITMYGGQFVLGSGAASPLLFNNRQIVMSGTTYGTTIQNNNSTASNSITINTDLLVTGAGAKTLTLSAVAGPTNVWGGRIVNGSGTSYINLTKAGAGTWILSGTNTYSGATAIQGGMLSINSIANVNGGASALGAVTNVANGTIAIGSTTTAGMLQYTGAGHTSDRVINLSGTTGGATLDASGTGPLVLTSALTATGAGAKTLTLTGASTAANTLGGAVVDSSSGATALAKSGLGTWVLSGANTYSGATTINSGTLVGVAGGSCPNSAVTVASAGTLVVSVTNSNQQWTCASLALTNGSQCNFNFQSNPGTSVAPLNITGNLTFSGTPVIAVSSATPGTYPLLVVGGTAPTSLPTLSGVTGTLSWGGSGNKTLLVNVEAPGPFIWIR